VSLYAPKTPPFDGGPATGQSLAGLAGLDARARDIFRRIVESYLETGEPVGSRTLSLGGIALSPASIRNTMQDLTLAGLLASPHASAGRIPTHAGLRLFVDGLLEIGDLTKEERREIDARLAGRGRNFEAALDEASNLLSGLAGGAGVVSSPVRDAGVKHVEFVALGGDQAHLAHEGVLTYTKDAKDAWDTVRSGRAKAALIVRHIPTDQVAAVAEEGGVMPQKSTYFFPKILSGFALEPLAD
jgi:heat-inducible transcriptional repressor